MKTCSICKQTLSLSQFNKDKSRKGGFSYRCKKCNSSINKKSYLAHLEQRLAKYKTYDHTVKLMLKYKLTPTEWDNLYEKQTGRCAICGRHQSETKENRRLCVDHDHITNNIRGLLCLSCNVKLGWLENNFEGVVNYLG